MRSVSRQWLSRSKRHSSTFSALGDQTRNCVRSPSQHEPNSLNNCVPIPVQFPGLAAGIGVPAMRAMSSTANEKFSTVDPSAFQSNHRIEATEASLAESE